jgi:hypothetical protein
MYVTPEIVKVEMNYRMEQALTGDHLEHVRVARGSRRPWWQRLFSHRGGQPPAPSKQVRLAS